MRQVIAIGALALVIAACGSGGLKGTLEWQGGPRVHGRAVSGVARNTTGHEVVLDPRLMRLLDADGRKVRGRFQVARQRLPAHASTQLSATWRSGKPVRIDYGAGALELTSP